jgi:RNA polymerase sigma factor (sigma-70 family)
LAANPDIGPAATIEASAAPAVESARGLFERYSDQIFRFCHQQLGSREEAEDAMQSTFLHAFRGLSRGIVPDSETAWLYKIAHNVCLARRRARWRRGRVEFPGDLQALAEVIAAPQGVAGERLVRLADALRSMPRRQRQAILLREWQGLSYREIGQRLELSQAAVETLLFRARRTLAASLEPVERRSRIRAAFDSGSWLATLKGLFGGGLAVKTAAVVAVVITSAGVVIAVDGDGSKAAPLERAPGSAPAPAGVVGSVDTPTLRGAQSQLPAWSGASGPPSSDRAELRSSPSRGPDVLPAVAVADVTDVVSGGPPDGTAPVRGSDVPAGVAESPSVASVNSPGKHDTTAQAKNKDDSPGLSELAPGHTGAAPGQSGQTPANGAPPPGQSGAAPGKSGETPGQIQQADKPDEAVKAEKPKDAPPEVPGDRPTIVPPEGEPEPPADDDKEKKDRQ